MVSAADAVKLIRSGDTVATTGFVGIGFPENIAVALEALYLENEGEDLQGLGAPRNLTLVYAGGQGDGKERGLNHLGHDGLVSRVIGGHWISAPMLGALMLAFIVMMVVMGMMAMFSMHVVMVFAMLAMVMTAVRAVFVQVPLGLGVRSARPPCRTSSLRRGHIRHAGAGGLRTSRRY